MGYQRDRRKLQPEVCQVTGRLVPADELVVCDVQGLRGVAVGATAPMLAKARFQPSPQDIQEQNSGPIVIEEGVLDTPGDELWYRTRRNEEFVPPDPPEQT